MFHVKHSAFLLYGNEKHMMENLFFIIFNIIGLELPRKLKISTIKIYLL